MTEKKDQILAELQGVGVSEHDALVLADCILSRKSCSWVNTDEVNDKMIEDLNNVIKKNNYGIKVKIDAIPTRSKFIWDVSIS